MGSELLGDIRREIDARLAQLLPAVEEYERLLAAIDVVGQEVGEDPAIQEREGPTYDEYANAGNGFGLLSAHEHPSAAPDSVVRVAILAALEHGSHTVAELAVVTGEGAGTVNRGLRLLARDGEVAKTEREGKLAWSLTTAV